MKVLVLNGSPHLNGTTMRALKEICTVLNGNNIDTEILTVGSYEVVGCIGCGKCATTGRCFRDDCVNEIISKIEKSDGLIIGSPVYYAGINGTLKSLLDRVFCGKKNFAGKPACAVTCARRGGNTSAFDTINKYFMISQMPVVSSSYWNMVFGSNAKDVENDKEGLQTIRNLGENLTYVLKCFEAGREKGIEFPCNETKERTNFIK